MLRSCPRRHGHPFFRSHTSFAVMSSQLVQAHVIKGLFFRGDVDALCASEFHVPLALGFPGIVSWTMATVWNEEALVDSYEDIEVDDQDLDGEDEYVEACFVLVVGGVGPWPCSTCVVDGYPEDCTGGQEDRRQEQDRYLVPEPSASKLFHTGLARYDETSDDEGDREERDDGEKGLAVKLDVAVDAFGVVV